MKNCVNKVYWGRGFALAALLGGLSLGSFDGVAQEKRVGDVAEDFELVNAMNDEPVRLSDFEGSVVVLDFFSYW